ncbi:hypothetical protein [Flavisolibacter ginsengisoli]|jgi:hypothetical protein|uniref:Glycosyltransferase family 10 (Fucosyltransferase) C-term n=1 Tax=Flavisolibacter ginsengisoli DSM 18119 TaxID=1121884 RepID=A0A1M5B9Y9_9BACT|nr:hypothetical protein [Flavisolibacter ginsengisoli]SHF39226.1 hypothetical protein SAMN02745131_02483 [Flavisolibacter ginsengisoli DSM 18119]
MPKNDIYVVHSNSKIESLYTLFPLLVSKFSNHINFLNKDSKEAMHAEGKCAILVRVFKGNRCFIGEDEKKRELIKDFKKRFDRVIMLDDGAGSDSLHFEYMDLVDLYYKGKLLKERCNYLKPMYGNQLFTNYYNQNYGINDDKVKIRDIPSDPSVLNKLRVSWNLGCGIYPVPHLNLIRLAREITRHGLSRFLKPWYVHSYNKMIRLMDQPTNYDNRLIKIHARFGNNSLPNTIDYQRKTFLQRCKQHEKVIMGSISPRAYNREIKNVAAVLSPFGWGEICFRDFEAIINNSVLIKPNMDHIETWPDVYKNYKTYIPVDWDGNNLTETIDCVLGNITNYIPIVQRAIHEYKMSFLEIDARVLAFLEESSGSRVNYY